MYTKMKMKYNLSKMTTADRQKAVHEHSLATQIKKGKDDKHWLDIDVFDRVDAERAETDWIPWQKRNAPALYRHFFTNKSNYE